MLRSHHDLPSRVVGWLTFFAGIAMLALVFSLAYHLFTQPVPGLNLSLPPKGTPPPAANIGLALSGFLEKLLLLALLTVVGSLVANKGIHMVFVAAHAQAPVAATTTAPKNGLAALSTATSETTPEKSAH